MAPTELLARQHYQTLTSMMGADVQVALLTSSTSATEKRRPCKRLHRGRFPALGTHALLSEQVAFHLWALVITDEQHRFGVEQRATLAAKGDNPHLLVMECDSYSPYAGTDDLWGIWTFRFWMSCRRAGKKVKPTPLPVKSACGRFAICKGTLTGAAGVYYLPDD